jgi:zinc D-Ala-D-Ala carboxypeptidase
MNTHLAALGISSDLIVSRSLRACQEATSLELAEVGTDGREYLLVPAAAEAWRKLKAAALVESVDIFIISAFRSIERQAEIIRRKLEAGAGIEKILTVFAPPGFSEHHTGRAVDISTSGSRMLEVEFDQMPAYVWLIEHAAEFGFYLSYPIGNACGYQYEPWHWCYQDAQA